MPFSKDTYTCRQALEQKTINPRTIDYITSRTGTRYFQLPNFFERKDLKGYLSVRFLDAYTRLCQMCEQTGSNSFNYRNFFRTDHSAGQILLGAHEIVARLSGITEHDHNWLAVAADLLSVISELERSVNPVFSNFSRVLNIDRTEMICDNAELIESLAKLFEITDYIAVTYAEELKNLSCMSDSDRKKALILLAHAFMRFHTQLVFSYALLGAPKASTAGEELFTQTLRYFLGCDDLANRNSLELNTVLDSYTNARVQKGKKPL